MENDSSVLEETVDEDLGVLELEDYALEEGPGLETQTGYSNIFI